MTEPRPKYETNPSDAIEPTKVVPKRHDPETKMKTKAKKIYPPPPSEKKG